MKKALGFAIIATFFALPAFAGETFVRNEDFKSDSRTYTNLTLDSNTYSTRYEKYWSGADKIYVAKDSEYGECDQKCQASLKFDFTVHNASAGLDGSFKETSNSKVWGTINTIANEYSHGHETSAGVR